MYLLLIIGVYDQNSKYSGSNLYTYLKKLMNTNFIYVTKTTKNAYKISIKSPPRMKIH